MKSVILTGNDDQILDIELYEILNKLQNGSNFNWCIQELGGVGFPNESILQLENKINNSPNGIFVTWEELIQFSKRFSQIINLLLIGDKDLNKFVRYENSELMYEECFYVIELIDSSYWEIHSKEDISYIL